MTGERPILLEAKGVTKRFGDFAANKAVDLVVREGEKHALLGENGAGKSTLVKMIYGVLAPSEGAFFWRGAPMAVSKPADARALGIGMVFQHFSVFDALSVAENIAVSAADASMRDLPARIREISARYGLVVDPDRALHSLSVGEKQRVEIIRCLLQEPKLLIMDEPTSVLTPQEADALFETLERLAASGVAILYISHKLDEVRRLCDAATILRRGAVVARVDPKQQTARSMAETMVGAAVGDVSRAALGAQGAARLSVESLSMEPTDDFGVALKSVSLSARGGEVLGIAGVAGEGQWELMQALIGERLSPSAEAIRIDGAAVGRNGPAARRRAGAAFVPEERNGHAAAPDLSLSENLVLSHHSVTNVAPRGWLDLRRARDWARRVREAFDVRAQGDDPPARSLSGGNLQKFVVGREILREPGVLVINQPTWGVDAGAAQAIRQALVDLARDGAAVVVISQDLEEIFEISDRIAVIHHGRLSKAHPSAEMTAESVGLLMGGAAPEAQEIPADELSEAAAAASGAEAAA